MRFKHKIHSHTHTHTGSWHIELYLTPSNLVYSTAGVLCALAVGIAIIIGLLQAREKVRLGRCRLLFTLIHFEKGGKGREGGRERERERERERARERASEHTVNILFPHATVSRL